ncbi:YqgE/AlgH family protein [Alphaproteobacteria bacterium]|nr:YqgE/AlgH family protein [Alphaproteobacteria bacterium]
MPSNLAGQLLVATPQMTDPRFKHKAIFMCQHDDKAAMGLVINNPSSDITLSQLNEKLGIEMPHFDGDDPVYIGGPVEPQRGYILHSNDHMMPDTIPVTKDICLSIHVDMIKEISRGFGPVMTKVMLGYAGWSSGQLEEEMRQNMWFHLAADPDMLFTTDSNIIWDRSFALLGITAGSLSSTSGTA